ncbi:MAG TPA: serine/threonine-protein kinase [Ktedonobacteraceae bacterium]
MNAEALVGKKLGSNTLRRVIGLGSMGAVYLARRSQSRREVVVKVFLHASELEPLQYIDFLVRFRHEMELVASLEHPHILSMYEYEERDGFIYLVMPYVSVRTLESVLNSQKILPLPKVADYLDQLAGALDYAHEHGVLHLDIKPSNILVSVADKLLFTDFALSKTMTERQAARIRQFKMGMLDYMAPEQVIGKEAGEKADLYSLGAVLYHMVTGSAPFQGESLVEVAKKQLQNPPPSPCSKRTDLPLAAQQVILRALAKHPADRYACALDLASAFRLTLAAPPTELTELEQPRNDSRLPSGITSTGLYTPYGLFDPKWRTDFILVENAGPTSGQSSNAQPAVTSKASTGVFVSVENPPLPSGHETVTEKTSRPISVVHLNPFTPVQDSSVFSEQSTNASGMLAIPDSKHATTGAIVKLASPVKVVNVPVTGQPGRYLLGLIPTPDTTQPEKKEQLAALGKKLHLQRNYKTIGLAMLVVLLLGTGALWFAHLRSNSKTPAAVTIARTPDVGATMAAQATVTAVANIILADPLRENIHNWPIMTSGTMMYAFNGGAYHITDNDDTRGAPAILPDLILKGPFVYTLTMEEIKGDDTSVNNEFGMIFRATIQNKNGKTITTFYSMEVLNKAGGEYQFWKYDNSQGSDSNTWNKLGSHPFGNEFHEGQGPKSINTFKIIANGKNFTLLVNGKNVWTFQDSSFASGGIGMLVNLKGTEVAFSNLLLTHN